ncbi:MAG TPA: SAM-dependent methyltransferase, partial [Blastocatellia bacterium]|nr:SAM-dependent methyltransferase [Blastocatellia bacterium]
MDRALYDSGQGYYTTRRIKIGPSGDYYTSSNVHPLFGATLATVLVNLWTAASSAHASPGLTEAQPGPFCLAEFGAGTGQLAFAILSTLKSECPRVYDRISYYI